MSEIPPVNRSAVRLLFGYEGREVRLLRKQWLDMIAPPSDPLYHRKNGLTSRNSEW